MRAIGLIALVLMTMTAPAPALAPPFDESAPMRCSILSWATTGSPGSWSLWKATGSMSGAVLSFGGGFLVLWTCTAG